MIRSPANAALALSLFAELVESFHRQLAKYHAAVDEALSYYPASTNHGGSRTTGVSDPTGERAVNPDPVQLDRHQAYANLRQAVTILGHLDDAQCAALGGQPVACPHPPSVLTEPEDVEVALNLAGWLVERVRYRWKQWPGQLRADPALDQTEAYADLEHAYELFVAFHEAICKVAGPDKIRLHCQNQLGCPNDNPPARDRLQCWACDAWFRRHDHQYRTRKAEEAEWAAGAAPAVVAPQNASEALADPGMGAGEGTPAEASTADYSGWADEGAA